MTSSIGDTVLAELKVDLADCIKRNVKEKIEKAKEGNAKPAPKPIDARQDDIHNQVAYKIAGHVFEAYVLVGCFPKATPTEIASKIGVIAKEIKATMEAKIEEIDKQ